MAAVVRRRPVPPGWERHSAGRRAQQLGMDSAGHGDWSARPHSLPQLLTAGDERFVGHQQLRLQIEGDRPFIADFVGIDDLAEEIEGGNFVPGRGDRLVDGQRLVPVLDQADFSRPVVDVIERAGSFSDELIVDIDHRAGRIAANRQPSPDAASGHEKPDQQQQ